MPSPPPPLIDGRLEVPHDWKTLPQSAVLWRRDDVPVHETHSLHGIFVSSVGGSLVGRHPLTGEVLWRGWTSEALNAVPDDAERAETSPWPGPDPFRVLLRAENHLVGITRGAIVDLDPRTGHQRWSIRLSERLRNPTYAFDSERLVLVTRGTPPLLIVVELASGAVTAMRLAPQSPHQITLASDVLLVASYRESIAVDLRREAPPIRERLSLDADVHRSLAALMESPRRRRSRMPTRTSHHQHPGDPREAHEWLARLGPLLGDAVTGLARTGTLEDATHAVAVLAGDERPEAREAVDAALRRSLSDVPDTERARVRSSAKGAFGPHRLPEELASALGESTARWVRYARAEGWLSEERVRSCRSAAWVAARRGRAEDPECARILATVDAITDTRDLLETSSPRTAPLARLRRAITRGRGERRCTPTEADAVRNAVLTHLFELELKPHVVVAPGIRCADVRTVRGRLRVGSATPTDDVHLIFGRDPPLWTIEAPAVPDASLDLRSVAPDWGDAPVRVVRYVWYQGPLAAHGARLIVMKIDRAWRVVGSVDGWLS